MHTKLFTRTSTLVPFQIQRIDVLSYPIRFISVTTTISEDFCSLSAKTLCQPATQTVCSTSISIQSKQSFLSFHFSPHLSIRVFALIPRIERICHCLSGSWWLKHHSGAPNFSWDIVHTSIVSLPSQHKGCFLFACCFLFWLVVVVFLQHHTLINSF